jgi:tripartite-type tricarboxylate transporter receptor subunit TctC
MANQRGQTFARSATGIAAALLLGSSAAALAQDYPNRPVRLIMPFPPGGGSDAVARVLAIRLGTLLGQSVVVDNRAGASGNIAAELVAKANPDGYTLIFGNSSLALAPVIFSRLPYDPVKDLVPVSMVSSYPFVLSAHPALPVKDVRELVQLAKSKPGELTYASAGVGTLGNFGTALFQQRTDIKLNHISYKGGGPAVLSVIAGETQLATLTLAAMQTHIRAGKLRGLAVLDNARSPLIPQVPTMREAGVDGVVVLQWNGIFATMRTPQPILDRLYLETVKALADPDLKERLAQEGAQPVGSSPAEFTAFFRKETQVWAEVAKKAGIKGD